MFPDRDPEGSSVVDDVNSPFAIVQAEWQACDVPQHVVGDIVSKFTVSILYSVLAEQENPSSHVNFNKTNQQRNKPHF